MTKNLILILNLLLIQVTEQKFPCSNHTDKPELFEKTGIYLFLIFQK